MKLMSKVILMVLMAILVTVPVLADQMVRVQVNGLVCDFCARALEKVFLKQEAVQSISVDLDKSLVLITLKEDATLEDATVRELIANSGYNIVTIKREDSHSDAQ